MSTKQLHTPIPMVTPKGEGFAHFIINDGQEADLYWIVIITETGEIWTFANKEVRVSKNITLGRTKSPQLRASVPVPTVDEPGLGGGLPGLPPRSWPIPADLDVPEVREHVDVPERIPYAPYCDG